MSAGRDEILAHGQAASIALCRQWGIPEEHWPAVDWVMPGGEIVDTKTVTAGNLKTKNVMVDSNCHRDALLALGYTVLIHTERDGVDLFLDARDLPISRYVWIERFSPRPGLTASQH